MWFWSYIPYSLGGDSIDSLESIMVCWPHLPFLSFWAALLSTEGSSYKYTVTYANTQMLSIKGIASCSLLLYCFSEFQLKLRCIVLRAVTWWIIKKCQIAKRGQQGKQASCWRADFPLVFAKITNLIYGKTMKIIRNCIIFYWVS